MNANGAESVADTTTETLLQLAGEARRDGTRQNESGKCVSTHLSRLNSFRSVFFSLRSRRAAVDSSPLISRALSLFIRSIYCMIARDPLLDFKFWPPGMIIFSLHFFDVCVACTRTVFYAHFGRGTAEPRWKCVCEALERTADRLDMGQC